MSDWKEVEDVAMPCSEDNGWCGWCGRCRQHSEDLREREAQEWEE